VGKEKKHYEEQKKEMCQSRIKLAADCFPVHFTQDVEGMEEDG